MKKTASILDYSYPFLDPAIWDQDRNLYAYQSDFIRRLLESMCVTYDLKQPDKWLFDVRVIGSLTTSKWLLTSDLDVHLQVDVEAFRSINMPEATKEEAFARLDATRLEFDRAKILAPMTQHPVEFYFESADFYPSNVEMVGVYSLPQRKWLKEPVTFDADLDFEESKKDVIAQAEALAEELDSSLGKIKRDIQRVDELEAVIKSWDASKQQLFYAKIENKLKAIEEEILKDIKLKQDLVDARHAQQNATSETEIKFKWLARFGFFGILSSLKTLMEQTGGQVTTQELPLIEKIISQRSIKEASNLSHAYWVDPAGKIYTVRPNEYSKDLFTHSDWVVANQDLLKEQYGLTLDLNCFKIIKEMYAAGWARIGDSGRSDMGYGITVGSLSHIPAGVDVALAQFYKGEELIVEGDFEQETVFIDDPFPNLQQAVNKALQQKRLGSKKTAAYGNYWIDPNGKVYDVPGTHTGWGKRNAEKLNEKFGYNLPLGRTDGHIYVDLLVDLGWVRIANTLGNAQFVVHLKSWSNIPSSVDDFVAGHFNPNLNLPIWVGDERMKVVTVYDPFPTLQDAVNKALRQPVVASIKQASSNIQNINGIRVYRNPSPEQAANLFRNSKEQCLRYIATEAGDIYVWDAYYAEHSIMAEDIGLTDDPNWYDGAGTFVTEEQAYNKAKVFSGITASLKEAFLKEAFEKQILAIDFDDTIAHENPDKTIGEPEEGVKEALTKLREDGYTLEIYSHRANDDKGADEIKDWLESHEIPYDNILNVEKPVATFYIDNRGIHFTNWADVVKQVETSKKTAALTIISYDRAQAAYWIDPSGKVYPVKTTHEDWFFENEDLLRTQYHYDKDEIGQDWWDIKTGNLLNQLLQDGWLRVGDLFAAGRKSIGTGIEIADLSSIPSTLIDFVANYGSDKYFQIEDLQKRVVELSVEELVAEGQEAVNRALQQEKMLSRRSALNLPVIDPKTLGRREPYALYIGTGDYGKAGKIDMFNVYGEHPMITKSNAVPTVTLDTLVKNQIPVIGKEPRAGDKQPFQDISKVFKQALKKKAGYDHAYWIDPKGEAFQVRGEGATGEGIDNGEEQTHSGWILENLDALQKDYGIDPESISGTPTSLIELGWIRVGDAYGTDWGVTIKSLRNIPTSVDNLLAQFAHEGAEITVTTPGMWQNAVTFEWPVKSVQQAVNQGLQRQQEKPAPELQQAASLKQAYLGGKYWIDPSGKVISTKGRGHINFDLLKELGQLKDSLGDRFEDGTRMIQEGWVRVTTDFKVASASFGLEIADINHVPKTAENFIDQNFDPNAGTIWIEDLDHKFVTLNDPVGNLQSKVNKALRQPVAASKTFSKKEIIAYTKKVKQGDYSCIMALVPHDLAQEIVEFGVRTVPDDKLYQDEDGKLGRELESHITIKYGLLTNDAKDVRRSFNDDKPFHAKLGKVRHFQPPELPFDVLTVEVISEELEKANKKICDKFDCAKGLVSDEYHPHITIAYMKRDTAEEYIGSDEFEGKEIELDTLIFSPHKGNRTYFSISQDKESQFILQKINKFAVLDQKYWIAPDGESFPAGEAHVDFILDHPEILDRYGLDTEALIQALDSREEGAWEDISYDLMGKMHDAGWLDVTTDTTRGSFGEAFGIRVPDIHHVPSTVDKFISEHPPTEEQGLYIEDGKEYVQVNGGDAISKGIQKAVNIALQHKRLQPSASKIASLFKIGDKVRDRFNGKIGTIKEIIGKEVILEEISHE